VPGQMPSGELPFPPIRLQMLALRQLQRPSCRCAGGMSKAPQHSTAQHTRSTAQGTTTEHSTAQHSTAQHSTAQHSTALGTYEICSGTGSPPSSTTSRSGVMKSPGPSSEGSRGAMTAGPSMPSLPKYSHRPCSQACMPQQLCHLLQHVVGLRAERMAAGPSMPSLPKYPHTKCSQACLPQPLCWVFHSSSSSSSPATLNRHLCSGTWGGQHLGRAPRDMPTRAARHAKRWATRCFLTLCCAARPVSCLDRLPSSPDSSLSRLRA
jgi:hypothetical protein